jgi:hypothetical protein
MAEQAPLDEVFFAAKKRNFISTDAVFSSQKFGVCCCYYATASLLLNKQYRRISQTEARKPGLNFLPMRCGRHVFNGVQGPSYGRGVGRAKKAVWNCPGKAERGGHARVTAAMHGALRSVLRSIKCCDCAFRA